jgi:glycine cleavage system H protein
VFPEDLKYTAEHEWLRDPGQAAGSVRVGITDFAQDALGDVVYVDIPDVGAELTGGEPFGEVESTKSVSDVYAPLSGTVVERNAGISDQPALLNDDPYGEGWMIVIRPSDPAALDGLMDALAYRRLTESEAE